MTRTNPHLAPCADPDHAAYGDLVLAISTGTISRRGMATDLPAEQVPVLVTIMRAGGQGISLTALNRHPSRPEFRALLDDLNDRLMFLWCALIQHEDMIRLRLGFDDPRTRRQDRVDAGNRVIARVLKRAWQAQKPDHTPRHISKDQTS